MELSHRQLWALEEQISMSQAKIEKLKGSKKAIKLGSLHPSA